jgi:glycosyltransferase involved in cell wall biosynthesis
MSELLAPRRSGELVPPGRPRRLAAAIAGLLASPRRRAELGRAARARVLREFGASRIGALMEESYGRAIERRRRLGPRTSQG